MAYMAANNFFHSGWHSKNSAEFISGLLESTCGEVSVGTPEKTIHLNSEAG
jgi:hypothetical protein